jgi:branched-chain amino acid aminotransferase
MANINCVRSTQLKPIPASDKLGFGQFFTDHMLVARYAEGKGWYQADILPYGPLQVDPGASVF